MKNFGLLFIFIGIWVLPLGAQPLSISQFDFLLGSWEMKNAKGNIVEIWTKKGKDLIGKSYVYHHTGKRTLTEKMKLGISKNEIYISVTGFEKDNKGTTNFKLITTKNNIFVFENKRQQFPQRIIYENSGKTILTAWIEGQVNGEKMKTEFRYQRKELGN